MAQTKNNDLNVSSILTEEQIKKIIKSKKKQISEGGVVLK